MTAPRKAAVCWQCSPNWASAFTYFSFSFFFILSSFSCLAFRDGGKTLQCSLFPVHSALPWCLPPCPKFPAAWWGFKMLLVKKNKIKNAHFILEYLNKSKFRVGLWNKKEKKKKRQCNQLKALIWHLCGCLYKQRGEHAACRWMGLQADIYRARR